MKIIGVVGKSGSGVGELLKKVGGGDCEFFDFGEETEKLLASGEEGYRQVINFFGEEFLLKNGKLNIKKLRKFVYGNFHKLRIFQFLMEPLLFNHLQKKLDESEKSVCIVTLPGLVEWGGVRQFEKLLWLDCSEELLMSEFSKKKLLIEAEKFVESERKLFVKPDLPMVVCKSIEELLVEVEKSIKSV